MPGSKSLAEVRSQEVKINDLFRFIEDSIVLCYNKESLLFKRRNDPLIKENENNTEYQHQEILYDRNVGMDRIFPLETVEIQAYNREHDRELEYANIHVGPFADELARSMNALAVTFANDIFFRGNMFGTSGEEGQRLLAHELTHAAQYEDGKINDHASKDELEMEAAREEAVTVDEPDQKLALHYRGNEYQVSASHKKQIINDVADDFVGYLQSKSYETEKDLQFLCHIEEFFKNPEFHMHGFENLDKDLFLDICGEIRRQLQI
jgi:hypothetical protein